MNLSPREKTLVVIAIYAWVLFCFVRFLYLPQHTELTTLQAENQQLTQEKMRMEASMQKQGQQASANVGSELAAIKEQLPIQEEMIPVLKYINYSIQECDVELTSLEYQGVKENEEAVRTLTFVVEITGSIFNLVDLLQQLLAAPRFISVADISLDACHMGNTSVTEEEKTPIYYIVPPGIPSAQLEKVKVNVEEVESGEGNPRVADSFLPDQFYMKLTINAYYLPEQLANATKDDAASENDTAPEAVEDTEKSGS